MNEEYLISTPILDFHHPEIRRLITERNWLSLSPYQKIQAAYDFVKDEIQFGYNTSDDLKASAVLLDGYGQCNTKGSLLMALLRALDIPCRFHGFTIDNQLQKGAIPGYIFWMAPKYIIHSWVEVYFDNRWINLEGFILDGTYLNAIQQRFSDRTGSFCGYGIATPSLQSPQVEWCGKDTYIQKEGIRDDYGVYSSPDDFYAEIGTNLSGIKRFFYQILIRHLINRHVQKIRSSIKPIS